MGSGRPHYHLVYIDDLLDGYELALTHPAAPGEAFIVAGPPLGLADRAGPHRRAAHRRARAALLRAVAPIHLAGDLCEAICVPFEIEPPLHRRRVDFWTKNRSFSIEKARRVLGYAPKVDVEEGIARTAAWYRQAGWL